jgi:ArsR family transcriptional regulator, arsenate/arsenite/antimonite-responsive transcriptional repressor
MRKAVRDINERHAEIFKALGDEKRLQILQMLRAGEKCACKLLEGLDINQSSLSYHMKILTCSGIVEGRQEGKWTHYSISKKGSEEAVNIIKEITRPFEKTDKNGCCESEKK